MVEALDARFANTGSSEKVAAARDDIELIYPRDDDENTAFGSSPEADSDRAQVNKPGILARWFGDSEGGYAEDGLYYPEGGWAAWKTVIGGMSGIMIAWGMFFTTGTIENRLSEYELKDEPKTSIAWIFSIFLWLVLSAGIISGLYFDKCGARQPLGIGSVLFIIGIFLTANCTKVWHFIMVFGVTMGVGGGMITSPILGSVSHYFYRRRGIASAIVINGGSIGGVFLPVMFNSLFHKVGFAWTLRITGFFAMFCLSVAFVLVREDKEKLFRTSPEDRDIRKNDTFLKKVINTVVEAFDYKALAFAPFVWCTIATCISEMSSGATLTYISSYFTAMGYEESGAYNTITILNSSTVIGGALFSIISDRWGHFNVMTFITAALGAVGFIIWLPFGKHGTGVMYAYSAIYGFFYGSMLNLAPVCCGKISRTSEFGRRYATMYVCVGFTFLVGIPISSAIIGNGSLNRYNYFIVYVSALNIISSFCFILGKIYALKWRASDASAVGAPGNLEAIPISEVPTSKRPVGDYGSSTARVDAKSATKVLLRQSLRTIF